MSTFLMFPPERKCALTLHTLINWRGYREQTFVFALRKDGKRMKQCFHRGAELFAPLRHAVKGIDLSPALLLERMLIGEQPVSIEFASDLLGDVSIESAAERAFFRSHPELNP